MYRRLPVSLLAIFLCFPSLIPAQHSIYAWKQYDNLKLAGWSEKKLNKVKRKLNPKRSGAFMVIHKGKVVASWGNYERRFHADAIKKTFISDVIGANIEHFTSRGMAPKGQGTGVAAAQSLQNYLIAHPGIAKQEESRTKIFPLRKYETPRPYSTRKKIKKKNPFGYYLNWEVNELAQMVKNELEYDVTAAFYTSIAYKLRMEDFRPMDGYLLPSPTFDKTAGKPDFYFKISARDLARIGQMYIQKGRSKVFDYTKYDSLRRQTGKWVYEPVIPKYWINNSTLSYSSVIPKMDGPVGYGYHWWVNMFTDTTENFAALGRGGQLLAVFPRKQIAIVHLSNTYKSEGVSFRHLKKLVKGVFKAKLDSIWVTPPETFLGDVLGDKPNVIPITVNTLKQYIGNYDVVHIEEEELAEKIAEEQLKAEQNAQAGLPETKEKKKKKMPPIPKAEDLKIKVVMKKNRLLMETSWMGKFYLLPIGKDLFLWEDARYQMSFARDENGKIDYVRIEGTE